MELFLLKLVVTPSLMYVVSRIVRRFGGLVGGLASGLPLTSGPIVVFIAVEQGNAFAAQTAGGALSGLAAVLFTYLAYVFVSRRLPCVPACALGLAFFAVCSWVFLRLAAPAVALLAGLLAIVAIVMLPMPVEVVKAVMRPASAWDTPLRMGAATAMLLAITASAHILGPHLSGILSPIPVIAWPLTIFTQVQRGRREMLAVIKGNAVSAVGVIAFYLIIRHLVLPLGLAPTVLLALAASVVVAAGLGLALRRRIA